TGYTNTEIEGRNHQIFVSTEEQDAPEYGAFWAGLGTGRAHSGTFTRLGKDGRELQLQGTYHPVLGKGNALSHVTFIASELAADASATGSESDIHYEALTSMSANIMLADNDRNIIFMNDALKDYFRQNQLAIRADFPDFDSEKLIGTNIDRFHKNPAHQESMLARLQDEFQAELNFGGRTTRVIACPIHDQEGNRIGTVAEWARTTQLDVEDEIKEVVTAALEGDLSQRISIEGKVGFLKMMSESVNQLVAIADGIISEANDVLSAMANGDLTRTIEGNYKGAFLGLKNNVNETVAKLTGVVDSIQSVSSSVRSGAEDISKGNVNLSMRTKEQASNLESTATSMEEMTSTVRQNAENAARANDLVLKARSEAESGGEVVRDAVNAMNKISTASNQIADIIGVIDEIAFQTNLLALNASVEAARAGEQGRGFAVVASEVRNLAGRSATAAKEIKELIEDSGRKVDEGTRLVDQSGEMLDSIVAGVKKITEIVGEIATASQEQSIGIDEVNRAIISIDELTQQNSSLVEEAATASQAMGGQAIELSEQISFFRTADGVPVAMPAAIALVDQQRAAGQSWG
ncbi:MAG: methyl-accepting chemotaxis protein, partial [Pseudomonadota bacterium]